MKKLLIILAAVALAAVSCNKEQPTDNPEQNSTPKTRHFEIKATIDSGTKGTYANSKVTFTADDKISVLAYSEEPNGPFTEQVRRRYDLIVSSVDGNTITFATDDIPEDAVLGDFAYYPHDIVSEYSVLAGGEWDLEHPEFNWPHVFDGKTVQIPMIGIINTSGATKSTLFKHVGAIAEIKVENAPEPEDEYSYVYLQFTDNSSAENKFGRYEVDPGDMSLTNYSSSDSDYKSCYAWINGDGTYYIPLPPGTYTDFSISLVDSYSTFNEPYYYKMRTSKQGTRVTLSRAMHADFGTLTYDADKIEEWYMLSDMTGWSDAPTHLRLIKTGEGVYEISSYVHYITSENPWYKFYSPAYYPISGVEAKFRGTMTEGATCMRAADELFTATLTKSGNDWVLTDRGYGGDWNGCYALGDLNIFFEGDFDNWEGQYPMTKINYNNNMIWYYEYFYVPDNATHSFEFLLSGKDLDHNDVFEFLGNSLAITDDKPYGQTAVDEGNNAMSFTLTPGYYNIYLDVKTLNFMFVKTLPSAPAPAM